MIGASPLSPSQPLGLPGRKTASRGSRLVRHRRLSRWRSQATDASGKMRPSYDRARRCSHLPQKSIWDRAKDAFCALPPLELSGGADAYLGIGASASLGISLDVRTLQFRGSVGGTLGAGFGGGLGVGAGAGATKSGYSQEISGTLAAGPGSVTVSQGGLSAGTGPEFGPRLGVWGGVSGKYTTPATPDLTGACNGQ